MLNALEKTDAVTVPPSIIFALIDNLELPIAMQGKHFCGA